MYCWISKYTLQYQWRSICDFWVVISIEFRYLRYILDTHFFSLWSVSNFLSSSELSDQSLTFLLPFKFQVFFVLRKKNNQITALHVYHHSIMAFSTWGYLKYVHGTEKKHTLVYSSRLLLLLLWQISPCTELYPDRVLGQTIQVTTTSQLSLTIQVS